MSTVYRGNFIHAPRGVLEVLTNAAIVVNEEGRIERIEASTPANDTDSSEEFYIPGLIDMHTHAAQYEYTGTATGVPLMQWIGQHAIPAESDASTNLEWATTLYRTIVSHTLRLGTTTSLYFGTSSVESCKVLAEAAEGLGQRAFVGVVAMDMGPGSCSTDDCFDATKAFLEWTKAKKSPLICPAVTPRFAPSCSEELLKRLGALSKEYDCVLQSHIAESRDEVASSIELHRVRDVELFRRCDLLNHRTVLAHGVHLTDGEVKLLAEAGASVVHCPTSHVFFAHGMPDVHAWRKANLHVTLGTDVAGGYSPSMIHAMRTALLFSIQMARVKEPFDPELCLGDVLHMATQRGADALGIGHEVGSFEVGKKFDAVLCRSTKSIVPGSVVDNSGEGWPYVTTPKDTLLDKFEKFVNLGDDRNIKGVWVEGKQRV